MVVAVLGDIEQKNTLLPLDPNCTIGPRVEKICEKTVIPGITQN
jgi:hypothetical protein